MVCVIDDDICIVCSWVADMPTPKVPSVQQRCTLCHAPIWVAKKESAIWPKVCLSCVKRGGVRNAMRRLKSRRFA